MNGFPFASVVRLVLVLVTCAVPALAEEPAAPAHSVLLCGSGVSPHYDGLVGTLSEGLHAKQVAVKVAAASDLPLPACLGKATDLQATSLVYLRVEAKDPEHLLVTGECYSAGGKKLWGEEAKGPWTARSLDEVLQEASQQLIEKIEAHVGKSGLEID